MGIGQFQKGLPAGAIRFMSGTVSTIGDVAPHDSSRRDAALSTDYLNRFVEAACLADLAIEEPQVLGAIMPWRDVSYLTYFEGSTVRGAGEVVERYNALPAECRMALSAATAELNRETAAMLVAMASAPDRATRAAIHAEMKPRVVTLIARAQTFANNGGQARLQSLT